MSVLFRFGFLFRTAAARCRFERSQPAANAPLLMASLLKTAESFGRGDARFRQTPAGWLRKAAAGCSSPKRGFARDAGITSEGTRDTNGGAFVGGATSGVRRECESCEVAAF